LQGYCSACNAHASIYADDDGGFLRTFVGQYYGLESWTSLGGVLTSGPDAASSGAAATSVFVRGTDNGLWQRSGNGTAWSAWQPLGGVLTSSPDGASCSAGHLDVYVLGTDGGIWHRGWSGSWSAWQPMGGSWTSSPSAVCRPSTTTVDLFERGGDRALSRDAV